MLGNERAGLFNTLASEIAAYEPRTKRLFVVNVAADVVDASVPNGKPSLRVIDISDPADPTQIDAIDLALASGFSKPVPTSVSAARGVVAASVVSGDSGAGKVLFFDPYGVKINEVAVGEVPDMVTFSPDRRWVLAANAGLGDIKPNAEGGSISVIDVKARGRSVIERRATFTAFNTAEARAALIAGGVRLYSERSNATVSAMLQPEYIAVSGDSRTAWVTLEVNNAIAVVNIQTATVSRILGLGTKDHNAFGNAFDASDGDSGENIRNWKIFGMYQPDAIAAYQTRGRGYLVTANEGDPREFEELRAEDLVDHVQNDLGRDPADALPAYDVGDLTDRAKLGRLKVSVLDGFDPGTRTYGILRAFGARSFSIWTPDADLVFDSGDALECVTGKVARMAGDPIGPLFNTPDDENDPDGRSDDRGPEPEGLALGRDRFRTYAFIGLERPGGLMVYDITNPSAPAFQQYINPRNLTLDPDVECADGQPESAACAAVGDLGPEGVLFIPASLSPTHRPLVVTANETSGNTRVYELVASDE